MQLKYRTEVDSSIVISDGKFSSSVGISVANGYLKLERYPLGKKLFGSEFRTEIGFPVGGSDGKLSAKIQGYTLGDALVPGYVTEGGSSYGVSFENVVGILKEQFRRYVMV